MSEEFSNRYDNPIAQAINDITPARSGSSPTEMYLNAAQEAAALRKQIAENPVCDPVKFKGLLRQAFLAGYEQCAYPSISPTWEEWYEQSIENKSEGA